MILNMRAAEESLSRALKRQYVKPRPLVVSRYACALAVERGAPGLEVTVYQATVCKLLDRDM